MPQTNVTSMIVRFKKINLFTCNLASSFCPFELDEGCTCAHSKKEELQVLFSVTTVLTAECPGHFNQGYRYGCLQIISHNLISLYPNSTLSVAFMQVHGNTRLRILCCILFSRSIINFENIIDHNF